MGVKKLWQAAGDPTAGTLSQFRNAAPIGVDGPNVIHPFARRHAVQLADGKWEQYARQVLKMFVALQKRAGVRFLVVFDGESPPMKESEAASRDAERERHRSIGLELLALGDAQAAEPLLRKAPSVGRFANRVAETLRTGGIAVAFAPYEAEAQLAYLGRIGALSAIWSSDSDVLQYAAGCRAPILRDVNQGTLAVELVYPPGPSPPPAPQPAGRGRGRGGAVPLPKAKAAAAAALRDIDALGSDQAALALACALAGGDFTPQFDMAVALAIQLVATVSAAREPTDRGFMSLLQGVQEAKGLSDAEASQLHHAAYAVAYHPVFDTQAGCVTRLATGEPVHEGADDAQTLGLVVRSHEAQRRCFESGSWGAALAAEAGTVAPRDDGRPSLLAEFLAEPTANLFDPFTRSGGMRLGYTECPGCGIHVGNGERQLHDASATHKAATRLRVLRAQKKPAWLSALSVASPTATPAPAGGIPPAIVTSPSSSSAKQEAEHSVPPKHSAANDAAGTAATAPKPATTSSDQAASSSPSPPTKAPRGEPSTPAAMKGGHAASPAPAAAAVAGSASPRHDDEEPTELGMTKRQRKQAEFKLAMQEKSAKRAEAKRLREAAAANAVVVPASGSPERTEQFHASPSSNTTVTTTMLDAADAAGSPTATSPTVRSSIMEAVLARFAQRPRN